MSFRQLRGEDLLYWKELTEIVRTDFVLVDPELVDFELINSERADLEND